MSEAAASSDTVDSPRASTEKEIEGVDSLHAGGAESLHIRDASQPKYHELAAYTLRRMPWRLRVTSFEEIVGRSYRGSGTEEDPIIVGWLNDDAENPKTFSGTYRWSLTVLLALMCFCVTLASSAYSGTIEGIIQQFKCSEELALLGLSSMLLGYAFGPILWAPLSEHYGRRYPLGLTLVFYTLWTAVSVASQNIWTLVIFRFFTGAFGSSALVLPLGTIADMYSAEQRGLGMAVFAAAPFVGPSFGPLIGGFLGDAAGWRWVIGLLGIFAAFLTVLGLLFLPETYGPVLLRRRAKRLTQATGKVYKTAIDAENRLVQKKEMVKTVLVRPWVLLFREPIVLVLTIYLSVVYGTLYLCFAAFPIVFQQGRGWNAGIGGLAFMGVFLGCMFAVLYLCYDNRNYLKQHQATGDFAPPECRLPVVIGGGVATVVGLAWFAATNAPAVHWAVPIAAGVPFGLGFVLVFIGILNYLVDAYVIYAASVLAANGMMRSLFGAIFPLFTIYMFENLGIHWATAVPGFIALVCLPFPILFYIYGARIRAKCKYSAEAARLLEHMKTQLERERSRQTEKQEEAEL